MHRTLQQTQHSDKAAHVAVADGCKVSPTISNESSRPTLTYQLIMKDCSRHINSGWAKMAIDANIERHHGLL